MAKWSLAQQTLSQSVVAIAFLVAASAGAYAQEPPADPAFPAEPDTAFVARLKDDADRAYERGNYRRAYRMFRSGLAWRGDKYAQYMVGYMHFNGHGVRADRPLGTAWLRLAAERGDETKLDAVYRDAADQLSDRERARMVSLHDDLVRDYGDRRVLRRLIRADRRALRRVTGSRTGNADMLPLTIQLPNGQAVPGAVYYKAIRDRMEQRLKYLEGDVTLGTFEVLDEAPVRDEPTETEPQDDAPAQPDSGEPLENSGAP